MCRDEGLRERMADHSYVALGHDTEQRGQCKWAHCYDNPLCIMPILKTFLKEVFLHSVTHLRSTVM